MIIPYLVEMFELLEEFMLSVTLMLFATILSLLLYKAKNYLTGRPTGSKEPMYNPKLSTVGAKLVWIDIW
ncbi:MAG: hypothetical protein JSW61_03655 [Candidatus Thorarchaeota archaeon]|nr:MAG: hypothetical protein JSW61_03655 [Candidatus Thorarchaeota archaeon]